MDIMNQQLEQQQRRRRAVRNHLQLNSLMDLLTYIKKFPISVLVWSPHR